MKLNTAPLSKIHFVLLGRIRIVKKKFIHEKTSMKINFDKTFLSCYVVHYNILKAQNHFHSTVAKKILSQQIVRL